MNSEDYKDLKTTLAFVSRILGRGAAMTIYTSVWDKRLLNGAQINELIAMIREGKAA